MQRGKKGSFTLPEGHQISVPQYLVYPAQRIKRLLLIKVQFRWVHLVFKNSCLKSYLVSVFCCFCFQQVSIREKIVENEMV
jgi:hypothetical protein